MKTSDWIEITDKMNVPHGRHLVIADGVIGFATYGQYKMSSPIKWYDSSYEINGTEHLITHFQAIEYPKASTDANDIKTEIHLRCNNCDETNAFTLERTFVESFKINKISFECKKCGFKAY